jgi:hypothetical protein
LIALGGRYAALCQSQTSDAQISPAEVGTNGHAPPSLNGHDHRNGHQRCLITSNSESKHG